VALQDVHPTSVGGSSLMSGAEVQANAISTVVRGLPLRKSPGALNLVLIVLLGLVGPVAAWRLGAIRSTLLALALAAGYAVAAQLAFDSGWIVSFVYPMASLVLGAVAALAIGLTIQAFERERVRDLFARFVPESVVDEVLASTKGELRLGGETRTVTVLFSDIRGFTTYAETRPPDEVIDVLNRYLGAMSDAVLENGGTLVSYMGDGIMAAFGAPIHQPDHAERALATARAMCGPVLDEFNEWLRSEGRGEGFRIGVGLNSGPVMAGNVGSQRRLEYTTIGDTTNTAARLEGMTKGTPHMVFIADSTRAALLREHPDLLPVADLEVRGRSAPVTVWSMAQDRHVQEIDDAMAAELEAPAEPEAAASA
jgi:adenylate cyclase